MLISYLHTFLSLIKTNQRGWKIKPLAPTFNDQFLKMKTSYRKMKAKRFCLLLSYCFYRKIHSIFLLRLHHVSYRKENLSVKHGGSHFISGKTHRAVGRSSSFVKTTVFLEVFFSTWRLRFEQLHEWWVGAILDSRPSRASVWGTFALWPGVLDHFSTPPPGQGGGVVFCRGGT